jgi:hypothetical protein
MRKLFFGLLLIVASCNNEKTEIEQKTNQQTNVFKPVSEIIADTAVDSYGEDTSNVLYQYKTDSLVQTIAIKRTSAQTISFKLMSTNVSKDKTATLVGSAKANKSDSEMDEDDDGEGFAVTVYHYTKGSCSLSIRIATGAKDKVVLIEYNCKELHDADCPFASAGVLKKMKVK